MCFGMPSPQVQKRCGEDSAVKIQAGEGVSDTNKSDE